MRPRLTGRIRRQVAGFVNRLIPRWFWWEFGIQIGFAHACAIHYFPEYTDFPPRWYEVC